MQTVTHRGCRIKVRAGRKATWGRMFAWVNGVPVRTLEQFSEARAIGELVRELDYIHAQPVDGNSWLAHWYAPGTYRLCEHGHPVAIGGTCRHTYCRTRETREGNGT